jgi:DNA-cytosine methyltransferase
MRKLLAIDLFSGCGGLTLGLKQAGFRVVAAIEMEKTAADAYRKNHPEVKLKKQNIERLVAYKLMEELMLKRGQLDLLAGCPPCQGFSVLRTQNGARSTEDKRNSLVFEMLRFARVFRPKAIMMENVPKLLDHPSFTELCSKLTQIGYSLTCSVKDAAQYGVPQRRRRLILLAGLMDDDDQIDLRRLGEAARYTLEPLTGLRFVEANTDVAAVFSHGPLVNQFVMYDEGEPHFIPFLRDEFLAQAGICQADVESLQQHLIR